MNSSLFSLPPLLHRIIPISLRPPSSYLSLARSSISKGSGEEREGDGEEEGRGDIFAHNNLIYNEKAKAYQLPVVPQLDAILGEFGASGDGDLHDNQLLDRTDGGDEEDDEERGEEEDRDDEEDLADHMYRGHRVSRPSVAWVSLGILGIIGRGGFVFVLLRRRRRRGRKTELKSKEQEEENEENREESEGCEDSSSGKFWFE